MRVTHHGDYLLQLTGTAVLFPVNCYLVHENDGVTLIDTGMPYFLSGILHAVQRLDVPLKRIALTHAHSDHIGSLDALHQTLPDAEVLFTAREVRILDSDRSLDAGEAQAPIKGSYPKVATRPTRAIVPGDRVGSLEVIAAPGHTPGQVAFRDSRDGSLIAGDAMATYGGLAVAGISRPIFPFMKMGTWDLKTATMTAQRLAELHPARLAVGHGRVLEHPEAAMRSAIAEAERRGA